MDETHERELDVLSHVHEAERRAAEAAAGGASADDGSASRAASSGTGSHTESGSAGGNAKGDAAPQGAPVSQRSIAQALGMSVGLTNAILKRLTEKGFLMMRRINAHNVHYLVTPEGIEQISRRSYLYLRRTIGHVVRYKERLRAFCRDQKERGIEEIVLVGESDLAFLLEWCAEKEGLRFRCVDRRGHEEQKNVVDMARRARCLASELSEGMSSENWISLRDVVLGYPYDTTKKTDGNT